MSNELPESACIGCRHNVGDSIPECVEPAAMKMNGCMTLILACAWREEKYKEAPHV